MSAAWRRFLRAQAATISRSRPSAVAPVTGAHADHPVWADHGGGLVEVAKDGDSYKKFEAKAAKWGSATGNPAKITKDACGHG